MRPHPFRRVAGIAAGVLVASALLWAPAPASAGPDDGKVVATQGHIDAPKTYWMDNGFRLYNENPTKTVPVDESVNWVGRGYSEGADNAGANKYQYVVPDSPSMRFAGEPGDVLYQAPALTAGNTDPTWVGFGADIGVPTEEFRDGAFFLDLLSVDGPGRVEMFNPAYDYPADVSRLLSSSDPAFASTRLSAGLHTHNVTTFSRPGRYELTYRTVARSTSGDLVTSGPQTQVWQVGGQRPAAEPTAALEDRFNAAPQGDDFDLFFAAYRFDLAPKADPALDGDEQLSTLSFTADPSINGTLTLFVNGYFLTDLPVTDGAAAWDELLGTAPSTVQAVFTPAEGSTGPRWVSQPLQYTPGATASTTSNDVQGAWPTPVPDPANAAQPTDPYTPTSDAFTIDLAPTEENPDFSRLSIAFADPNMRGALIGAYYADPDDKGPLQSFETGVVGAGAGFPSNASWNDGATVRVTFVPHPSINARGFTIDLPGTFTKDMTATRDGHFTIGADGANTPENLTPTPTPTPTPTTEPKPTPTNEPTPTAEPKPTNKPAPTPTDKPAPTPTDACHVDGRLVLDDGHVDIRASLAAGAGKDALGIHVADETGIGCKRAVDRRLDEVAFAVGDQARHQREGVLLDPALDVLGPEGATYYALPQTQIPGTLWPGYSTQGIDFAELAGGVQLHLDPQQIPDGAAYTLFTTQLGKPTVAMDSSRNDTALEIDYATHTHTNWAFTKPGVYLLDAYYTGTAKDGTALSSEHQTLAVLVGDRAIAAGVPDADQPDADQPDADQPDADQPEAPKPGASKPEAPKPEAPQAPKPDAPKPQAPKPGAPKPQAPKPQAPKPQAPKPQAPKPGGPTAPAPKPASPAGQGVPMPPRSGSSGGSAVGPGREVCLPVPAPASAPAPGMPTPGAAMPPAGGSGQATGSYTIAPNTHAHPNWVFSAPGTYKLHMALSATGKDGKPLSATTTLTFEVGGGSGVTDGHFDFGAQVVDGQLVPAIKDDRQSPATWVSPEELTFSLGDAAKVPAPAGVEFVAQPGQDMWMVPSTQIPGVPWLGVNSMHESLIAETTGELTLALESVEGPGNVAVFSSGNFGQVVGEQWFSTAQGAPAPGAPGAPAPGAPAPGAPAPGAPAPASAPRMGKTPSGKDCRLDGQLASTGSDTLSAPLAGLGAGLLTIGTAMLASARRRP